MRRARCRARGAPRGDPPLSPKGCPSHIRGFGVELGCGPLLILPVLTPLWARAPSPLLSPLCFGPCAVRLWSLLLVCSADVGLWLSFPSFQKFSSSFPFPSFQKLSFPAPVRTHHPLISATVSEGLGRIRVRRRCMSRRGCVGCVEPCSCVPHSWTLGRSGGRESALERRPRVLR